MSRLYPLGTESALVRTPYRTHARNLRFRDALISAFRRGVDFEDMGDDTWVWLADPLLLRREAGRFVLEGERLVLETEIEDAVEEGRDLLGRLAGDAVEFRRVERDGAQLPLGANCDLP